jgi:hypothetical protein
MKKLKWFNGAVWIDGKQRHVTVCATSRKRVLELLRPLDVRMSQYYVNGWFSCTKSPPNQMKDKPVEEAVWLEETNRTHYVRVTTKGKSK